MAAALRTVRLVQIALLVSIVLYVVVGEKIAGRAQTAYLTVFYAFSFVSISVIGAIFVVRRTMVAASEVQLLQRPTDRIILGRWKAGHIVTYALCESLALFGLVLRSLGFALAQVWPFYLGGLALMLFFSPRAPQTQVV